jgi:hypothetical protein
MKFNTLYNNVFITEQDETMPNPDVAADVPPSPVTSDGVPSPDNYSVEPAPVTVSSGNINTVKEFVVKLEEYADSLNGVDNESLQKLVNDLDRKNSLFEGISRETSSDIIRLAELSVSLSEKLKGFIINSVKRSRDMASLQGN